MSPIDAALAAYRQVPKAIPRNQQKSFTQETSRVLPNQRQFFREPCLSVRPPSAQLGYTRLHHRFPPSTHELLEEGPPQHLQSTFAQRAPHPRVLCKIKAFQSETDPSMPLQHTTRRCHLKNDHKRMVHISALPTYRGYAGRMPRRPSGSHHGIE